MAEKEKPCSAPLALVLWAMENPQTFLTSVKSTRLGPSTRFPPGKLQDRMGVDSAHRSLVHQTNTYAQFPHVGE